MVRHFIAALGMAILFGGAPCHAQSRIHLLQGLSQYSLVAGKTTAIRIYTTEEIIARMDRIEATILRADGSRHQAYWSRSEVTSVPGNSLGPSMVVRVPGWVLRWVGRYAVQARVFAGDGTLLTHTPQQMLDLLPTRDLRVLVDRIWSGTDTKPGEVEAARRAMERLSALYPVRDGVSAFDQDRSAGLRYILSNQPDGPPNQDAHLGRFIDAFRNRPAHQDSIDVAIAYRFPNEGEGWGANADHAHNGVPFSVIVWGAETLTNVFSHEMGHNLGLVPPGAPHHDGGAHSKNIVIAPTDAALGYDVGDNRPFPNPTYDLMYPTLQAADDVAISFTSWDWEHLRKRLVSLRTPGGTGPTQPYIAWTNLEGHSLQRLPAVARNADGRQEVFVLGGDRRLYHRWESAPGDGWNGWATLDGHDLQAPVIADRQADGSLIVFVRGGDRQIYFRRQAGPNGGWHGWERLGGVNVKDFAIGRNADGRLEALAVWGDGSLRTAWQTAPNGPWSVWASLEGHGLQGAVTVGRNADGRLEAFVVGGDGVVYHRWQVASNSTGAWSGWSSLGDRALPKIADVVAERDAHGRLFLFMTRADGRLSYRMQSTPGGAWSPPLTIGGTGLRGSCAVGRNSDGRLELFVIGVDRQLYSCWQANPEVPNLWSGWQPLGGHSLQDGVAVGLSSGDELQVFVIGGDSRLYRGWR